MSDTSVVESDTFYRNMNSDHRFHYHLMFGAVHFSDLDKIQVIARDEKAASLWTQLSTEDPLILDPLELHYVSWSRYQTALTRVVEFLFHFR